MIKKVTFGSTMMKILSLSLVLSSLSGVAGSSAFVPARLAFDELNAGSIRAALKSHGILSVTDVPGMIESAQPAAAGCGQASVSRHTFPDGTVRSTVATHPGDDSIDCPGTGEFRSAMGAVADGFASALSKDLAAAVSAGDHLEHFHTYEKEGPDAETDAVASEVVHLDTVEWHTDQGLFIVFTPGRLQDGSVTNGFFVRLADGSEHQVMFDSELDRAIVMPGDMITEFVEDMSPTAHRLALPAGTAHRSWYGRMVLPAQDALFRDGVTFGQLRERMIDGDKEALAIGCPSSAGVVARQLEVEACEEGTLLCWHRCMPLDSEETVSDEICAERGLSMECINPRGQLWTGFPGDYFPGCVDAETAENHTDYPALPVTCDGDGNTIEVSDATDELSLIMSKFKFSVKLNGTMSFAWNVKEDSVHAALVIEDEFGWLAWGFPSDDGKRRGMHGASIVMAYPGGDYSAVTGLDTSLEPTIAQFIIDPQEASFRKWMEPVAEAPGATIVRTNDCASVLEITASEINGMSFNLNGTDAVIWGGNSVDSFVGYHGCNNRGVMNVTWSTGVVSVDGTYLDVVGGEEPPMVMEEEPESSTSVMSAVTALVVTIGLAAVF